MLDPPAELDKPRDRTPRYQPLVIVLVAVCAGIVGDRFWPRPVLVWWAGAGGAWCVWLGLWRWRRERAAAAALLLAVAATAAGWHHCRWYLFAENDLGYFTQAETQPVCVEAIALKSPRVVPAPDFDPLRAIPRGDQARLNVELTAVRDGTRWRSISGRSRLTIQGSLSGIEAGDRLRIFGQLSMPRGAQNPGEFDYARYLRAQRTRGLLWTTFAECVSVVQPGRPWSLPRLIDRARVHGNRLLGRYLDHRRSALAAAVLLGARERLDPDQTQAFVETGTVHLLAISGLHVGILAGALMFVMLRAPVPRAWAMLTVAAATVFYMLLTDARPPVIRATILVLVICWSVYLGRRVLSFNSLAAAGLIVLAVNPADLFRTGAQLSFLAVAGLMWFGPLWTTPPSGKDPLERMLAESQGRFRWTLWLLGRSVRSLILVTGTIWLLLLPLVMARFNLLTPVAVVLNTLLWVPIAVALMAGFATLVFGTLAAPLGHLFGGLCNTMLWVLQSSVAYARDLPLSHLWVPGPADWWLVGFYGGLGLLAAVPKIRPPRRWCLALLAGWSAVGFVSAGLRHDDARLNCTFLSVGHGCAVVLELPGGQTMLYDAGRFDSPVSGTRSIAGFLWSRGITHLDAVVISHADIDHYNALPGLLKRFSVGAIYVSPVMWEEENPAMTALHDAIDRSDVQIREIHAGKRLHVGNGCTIEVLHPPRKGVLGGDNANSIVLMVEYLGRRILLPGDLKSPGLEDLLAEEPLDCDVLLAPHHGSRRSNPPGFATWTTPEWVVISGRRRANLPATRATYEAVGSRVLHTAGCGSVGVTIDASGLRVETSCRRVPGRIKPGRIRPGFRVQIGESVATLSINL